MDSTSIIIRLRRSAPRALSALFLAPVTILSEIHINTAPHKKPPVATRKAGVPSMLSALSMAGCSNDQKLAATMTPAANPSIRFSVFPLGVLKKTTVAAPRAVTDQVPNVATRAITKISFISHPLIFSI